MTHLRYDLWSAQEGGVRGHAQHVMRELGITYQYATPQSIADQWWFWNCANIPNPLPPYLTVLNIDPLDAIGNGLSKDLAESIKNAEGA